MNVVDIVEEVKKVTRREETYERRTVKTTDVR